MSSAIFQEEIAFLGAKIECLINLIHERTGQGNVSINAPAPRSARGSLPWAPLVLRC